ncbi:MAG: transposase [Sphaerochaeta sp.]|nr:transposase [Sphaerochaeta sp.]
MKWYKALKVRVYPNAKQTEQLNKTLGCARAIYNMMLHERITVFEENKDDRQKLYGYTYKEVSAYKKEYEWLKEADSQALAWEKVNLLHAYSNFFTSLKGERKGEDVGFPKYKKKKTKNSYTSSLVNRNMAIDFNLKRVKLPKLGWIQYRDQRSSAEGKIKSVTVSRSTTGKYFASFLFEYEAPVVIKKVVTDPEKVVGLDMALENFYVDHEGNTPGFTRNTRRYETHLAQAQRRLSKKKKGSQNWYKAKHRVALVHETIANARADFNRKLATELCSKYDAVCIETLSLKGMSRALNLGKSVHDLGYANFVSRLKQKAAETGTNVIQVDKWYPSSKLCSNCGYKNKALGLTDRNWTCPNCGEELSRDENAGKNLRNVGLDLLGLGKPSKLVEKIVSLSNFGS